ncbi:DNA helicase II related protein [hydrothermal vent metagenome]|uniref:DNA helicase II related protein n=1 Tax=hydrothermal vent metagenome TaxID=652676 RepID=A0A3B0YFD4_9ZZZZ
MAEIIPPLNQQTLSRMTAGEKRLARRLEALLEQDYLVWYDIPVGKNRRYPDFIILHPARGLLFLEVKDWKSETIKKLTVADVTLQTNNGMVIKPHPLEQVRQCTYAVINRLSCDPQLRQVNNKYNGNLVMPYAWGVVFTNITRNQIEKSIADDLRETLLPDHLIMYKNDMLESADAETFQEQLWGMFNYNFGTQLTLPQIDRIRWHLFPEIRINDDEQVDLFTSTKEDDLKQEQEASHPIEKNLPDIIKIMDIQQEQLARSIGEGHRIIHGVAGSGKTMILGFRCLYLAQAMSKPILVLCFNITLAAKLRSFISAKGIEAQVQIYHFHDWCKEQLKTYHVELFQSEAPVYERQVETVISAVEKGFIPKGQYGALLIDEGHDFDAEWLKLIVQMVDPETNSLLMLYDDAQSIYKNRTGLGFSLSSVGIQAKGRTTILKLNYRNTREILDFSYAFAKQYLAAQAADEDHIPLIEPQAAGNIGAFPVVKEFSSLKEEIEFAKLCIQKWLKNGILLREMAILCVAKYQGEEMAASLSRAQVPNSCLITSKAKSKYSVMNDMVTVLTVHSSKGLEFQRVIIIGVGSMNDEKERLQQNARLLYVGMTRAQSCLLMTTSARNEYSRKICKICESSKITGSNE